jgi:hypothetical protein
MYPDDPSALDAVLQAGRPGIHRGASGLSGTHALYIVDQKG